MAWLVPIQRIARALTPLGWLSVALCVVIVVLMSTCVTMKIRHDADARKAVIEANEDRDVRETLSDKRTKDAVSLNEQKKALDDALDAIPDSTPSARRIARACVELRSRKHEPLPAECGPPQG